MRAEIWLGGLRNEAYRIDKVKKVETSIDGVFCKITDEEGFVFETSPHNVVICYHQKEQENNNG
jgi:hypothetical protein